MNKVETKPPAEGDPAARRLNRAVEELIGLVRRLRGPGGCPWDAKQDEWSVKTYVLEEAYEVVDAVERGGPDDLCEELGDLLFQIVFLACLGEERQRFSLADVVERITQKMIRRHPHVFGDASVTDAADVAANWARIKSEESNSSKTGPCGVSSVPPGLPALLRAHRLTERAAKAGCRQSDGPEDMDAAVDTAWEAFRAEGICPRSPEWNQRLGDLLFSLANVAREQGANAEDLLRTANNRFVESLEGPSRGSGAGKETG